MYEFKLKKKKKEDKSRGMICSLGGNLVWLSFLLNVRAAASWMKHVAFLCSLTVLLLCQLKKTHSEFWFPCCKMFGSSCQLCPMRENAGPPDMTQGATLTGSAAPRSLLSVTGSVCSVLSSTVDSSQVLSSYYTKLHLYLWHTVAAGWFKWK